jgi:hypothetical protein
MHIIYLGMKFYFILWKTNFLQMSYLKNDKWHLGINKGSTLDDSQPILIKRTNW